MLTAHILTKNNSQTIRKCLESIIPLQITILIGDLGSTDGTTAICEDYGLNVSNFQGMDRSYARNLLQKDSETTWNMWIEPWEFFFSGHLQPRFLKGEACYASVLRHHLLTKEIRFWTQGQFINPIYERLDLDTNQESDVVFCATGDRNLQEDLQAVERWKVAEPLATQPYYYQACLNFALGHYDEFYRLAEHYLFLEPKASITTTMTRYYYALANIIHRRKVKPALQNLNLCLCHRPLMAEFWCLMGDAYYHLLKKPNFAKEFYENAITLGSRRLKSDKWPMDISKYNKYPKMMIDSCEKILASSEHYGRYMA